MAGDDGGRGGQGHLGPSTAIGVPGAPLRGRLPVDLAAFDAEIAKFEEAIASLTKVREQAAPRAPRKRMALSDKSERT